MTTRYRAYVTVSPGLEDVLLEEVDGILTSTPTWRTTRGGIEGWLDPIDLWSLAHFCRVAEGLRIRVGRFDARTFAQFVAGLKKAPLAAYLAPGARPKVQVTSRKSKLMHTGAIAERVEKVLNQHERGLGPTKTSSSGPGPNKASSSEPGPALYVRLFRDKVTLSIDAAGQLLHRRGHRVHVGQAPLRETLAAACLRLAGYQGDQALWDPFCGSGTFLMEALDASRSKPRLQTRAFAFESWPTHDHALYGRWKHSFGQVAAPKALVFGSDRDPKEIKGALSNLETFQGHDRCHLMKGDFKTHVDQVLEGACIVTNPPYGKRLKGDSLWVEELGNMLRERRDLRPVHVLSPMPDLAQLTGHPFTELRSFLNGGLRVRLWRLEN